MTQEIWERFKSFYKEHGHLEMPPASVVPENDASVLFTTAGMQQFKGFYLKPETAPSVRIISCQPCVRTSDIEEVGDNTHLTVFEMLGNFSFGYPDCEHSYFKEEAIKLAWQFLTKELGIDTTRLHATYFYGDDKTPKDTESKELLKKITDLPEEKIYPQGREDNFWGPTGFEGPCGPTVEFHVDNVEIWNLVFNEFYFKDGKFTPLKYKGVDTGFGLDRVGHASVYENDCLAPLMQIIGQDGQRARIIADHIRAIAMTVKDGVRPLNKEQGYVLRRLIRRAIKAAVDIELPEVKFSALFAKTAQVWQKRYPEVGKKLDEIVNVFATEHQKYSQTIKKGSIELKRLFKEEPHRSWGKEAFYLYESFGLPPEMTYEDLVRLGVDLDLEKANTEYKEAEKTHQNLSRAGVGKFKGGLSGHLPEEVRMHTATHLLQAALRTVLGNHVFQKGSNITSERLRFDFSHPQKMTTEEIKESEHLVNQWISEGLKVTRTEMAKETAKKSGALGVFDRKYGDNVSVYTIGEDQSMVSKELCGGPHVANTRMIGRLKIVKEEASSAGVRRIKAILENSNIEVQSI